MRKQPPPLLPFYNRTAFWLDGSDHRAFELGTGNLITATRDKSPEGNHPTQATGSLQPSFVPAAKNGLSVTRWDGSRYLNHASGLFSLPNANNTFMAVAKRNTETGSAEYLNSFTEAGSVRNYVRASATAGNYLFHSGTAATGGISSSGNTNTEYQIIIGWKVGTSQSVSVNGRTVFTNTSAANESGIDGGQVGALVANGFITGDIGEMALWRFGMSDFEREQLQYFMSSKWDIPLYI